MDKRSTILFVIAATALSGCAAKRWEPQTTGPLSFDKACPGTRAPVVADFGPSGVHAVYNFAISGADRQQIVELVERTEQAGLKAELASLMLVVNGANVLFTQSRAPLRDQAAVDAEYAKICTIRVPNTHLTHVRYNRVGVAEEAGRMR